MGAMVVPGWALVLVGLAAAARTGRAQPAPHNTCLKQQRDPWPGVGTLFCCGGNTTSPATAPCSRTNDRCCAEGSHSSNGGAGTSPCVATRTPQYHVRDASCAMNDPNAPFFDPVHQVYHVFWQAHLAQVDPVKKPGGGPAVGPVYGHAVSRDLVSWAHLPVSLWNDEFYDSKALYTGSATLVDGRPVIVYPGISDPPTGGTFNVAEPADRDDPLLERWIKSSRNPMMTGTSDDPSSAWQTDAGEWRFVGQTFQGGLPLYSAGRNFSSIHLIGIVKHEQGGDCMSLFPLPPTINSSPGSADAADGGHNEQPTHVMLQSGQTKLGVWKDAPIGNMSTWRDSFDVPKASAHTCGCTSPECTANFQCGFKRLELGARYAEKDFWDPIKRRRLLWGWAVVDEGSLGLLRELQYDERLGPNLITAPLQELSQLREQPALASLSSQTIPIGGHLWLGDQLQDGQRGNQSELRISFQRPKTAVVLGVDVMAGSTGGTRNASQRVYIVYEPQESSVRVGVASGAENLTARMNATRLTVAGHNLPDPPTVAVHSVDECAERCSSAACAAWSVNHTVPAPFACVLLGSTGWDMRSDPTTQNFTSGVAGTSDAAGIPGVAGQSDTLQLLPSDTTLDIAVYTDNTILEVYIQGGRVAMTLGLSGDRTGMDVFAFSSSHAIGSIDVAKVDVWAMKSIWTAPDAVRKQPLTRLNTDDDRAIVVAEATPAADLQAQFEVLPDDGNVGWLGADSDVSIMISGGKTGARALWIFADTYISSFNKAADQRLWSGMQMPHSTVALIDCTAAASTSTGERQCSKSPKYHYRKASDGSAQTFWLLPPDPDTHAGAIEPLLWPVAGIASRDGKTVVLLAQRILGGLNVEGTTAIVVDVTGDDPTQWPYQTTPVPSRNGTLNWFSSIFFVKPEDLDDTEVYLFGHDSTIPGGRQTILARADLAQLVQHDWSALQYWQHTGWSDTYETSEMKPLNVPSWETTCHWSSELGVWFTFDTAPDDQISLWTAVEVTGEWSSTVVYKIPGPFSGTMRNGSWLCYAAKSHPELVAKPLRGGNDVELVFSWICNTWGNDSLTIAQEFQPGGMSLSATSDFPLGIRGYWMRLMRVTAKLGAAAESTTPSKLVDYTSSRLRLPVGISPRVTKAVEARLSQVRSRVPSFAASVDGKMVVVAWGQTVDSRAGSYILAETNGRVSLVVQEGDEQALLAGVSRLVRELRLERRSATAKIPRAMRWVHNASEELWPMRGQQVSTAHYTSSLKTWSAFHQYASELAVFGTNQIEVAHINNICDENKHCVLPEQALVNFSTTLQEVGGLAVSMWFPLSLCNLSNVEEVFMKMPLLTSLLHESGWDKQSGWQTAASCARTLRKYHSNATIWAAAAAHNSSLLAQFFSELSRPELAFVSGLATHMAPVPFPQYVAQAPKRLAIRQYPDLCHTVHAQFPKPQWDYIWAVVHVRNPVSALPEHMSAIVRQASNGSSPNIGVGGYSEGLGDDVNKIVWSLLAAEPELSVEVIIRQYSRYHFGAEHEDAMTAAIFGLELNWLGDIRTNKAVQKTLAEIQSVEKQMTTAERQQNWRFLMLAYRAYFDAHVQARFLFELDQQERAYQALEQAPAVGFDKAAAAAVSALNTTNEDTITASWHSKVLALAHLINTTLGASVLQSQATDLNLRTFATELNDKRFILSELATISKLPNETDRLAALSDMLYWDVPKAGGFFDRLGSAGVLTGRAPHLDTGQGDSDPAFYFTPHHETLSQLDWAGKGQDPSSVAPARIDWTSFTRSQSQGRHPLRLSYEGLDPDESYTLSILFFSSEYKMFATERNTVTVGSTVVQKSALSLRPMRRVSFAVPRQETAGGKLSVLCTSPLAGGGVSGFETGGCSIIAVWLEPSA